MRTPVSSVKRRALPVLGCGVACSLAFLPAPALAQESTPQHVAETPLDGNGATWTADVPADWNGTLVLFSHGFNTGPANPAENAPDDATAQALLERGYALAGSSYERAGWSLDTAAGDQLETLEAFSGRFGAPSRTIALGRSMGGLVAGQLAELDAAPIDGVVSTCGIMAGGVQLLNYQLDGLHALATLLLPDREVKITGFTGPQEWMATASALSTALDQAQGTTQGRARIALAATFLHVAAWAEGSPEPAADDYDALQQAQYANIKDRITFLLAGRHAIEQVVGGNSSWNAGVDYASLVEHADEREQVRGLYRAAGLDLDADLATLTASAGTVADPAALVEAERISGLSGQLNVPVLSIHTTHDTLVPAEMQEEYAETVGEAGSHNLLRQAYVYRLGHCTFTPAETVAAVTAMGERLDTGHWTETSTPRGLDDLAESLGIGESAFEPGFQPSEWLGDRGGVLPGPEF